MKSIKEVSTTTDKEMSVVPTGVVAGEVLILPISYLCRTVIQIAPKRDLEGPARTILINTSSAFVTQHNKNIRNNLAITDGSALSSSPFPNTSTALPLTEETILVYPRRNRLRFLYGISGHGKSSLMINQIINLQQKEETMNRWISYMDLRRVAWVLGSLDETWTLSRMILEYNSLTNPDQIKNIKDYFQPEQEESDGGEIQAELFLDEIDKVPVETQKVFLTILKKVDWTKSKSRVWVATRPHLKPFIDETFDEDGDIITSFELLPFSREEQIVLLMMCWKVAYPNLDSQVSYEGLKIFATDLHTHLEQHIPNFFKTLGACPFHLQLLATFFSQDVEKFLKGLGDNMEVKRPKFNFNSVSIFDMLLRAKFDAYLEQWLCELSRVPVDEKEREKLKEAEFLRLEKLHLKFAISTYGSKYGSYTNVIFHHSKNQEQLEFEVFKVGLIYRLNGRVEFLHAKYAEYLLAQYFADYGRTKNTKDFHLSFFFNKVLFEDASKCTRKFFNDYWELELEKKHKGRHVGWSKLRQFLTTHYFLEDTEDESENDSVSLSYEDIKNYGSVLHLALIEGNVRIYELIFNSFKGYEEELGRLLGITAPLDIFSNYPFKSGNGCKAETHKVTCLQMLALFARGGQPVMERLVASHLKVLEKTGTLQKYFEEGTWTPLHYAGLSSNVDFLRGLFHPMKIKGFKVDVKKKNPLGQEAIHLVLESKSWYFSMKILNRIDPPTPIIPIRTTGTGKKGKKAISKKATKLAMKHKRLESLKKDSKEIWAFQGIKKDFNEELTSTSYPSQGEGSSLQEHFNVLDLLFGNGASVNSSQENGKTPLHLATSYSSTRLITFLLRRGADTNSSDKSLHTPAHYAAENGNLEVLMMLNGMEVD